MESRRVNEVEAGTHDELAESSMPHGELRESADGYTVQFDLDERDGSCISVEEIDGTIYVTSTVRPSGKLRFAYPVIFPGPVEPKSLETEYIEGTVIIRVSKAP